MCTISFAIAVKSIQDKRKNSFRVFKLIGMSKFKAYLWMVFEIVCICFAIWIVACVIYFVLDKLIFYKLMSEMVFPELIFYDYAILGLIYCVLVSIIASLTSTKELFASYKNKNY